MFERKGINKIATGKDYALDKKLMEARERNKVKDEHEHIVDIEAPEVKEKIAEAKKEFEDFFQEFGEKMDLSDEKSIEAILEAAAERGIYDKAKNIRELIYGKNISIYGVCYLSGACNQHCEYCPFGVANLEYKKKLKRVGELRMNIQKNGEGSKEEKAELEALERETKEFKNEKLKTLTLEQAEKDLDALVEVGHQEVCILSGELGQNADKLMNYVAVVATRPGIKEIILNAGAFSDEQMEIIRTRMDNVRNSKTPPLDVALQFRIFQETYDREAYPEYMKNAPNVSTGKKNFSYRYESQVRALKSGAFQEVGIGALFGLSKNPLAEIKGLKDHAEFIKREGGKEPKRCCLPIANEPEGSKVRIDYKIPGSKYEREVTELTYALARLSMPTVSIVSSERDDAPTLEMLDQYANHSTLFVHPSPEENVLSLKMLKERKTEEESKAIGQAKTNARHPDDALTSWESRDYNILDFDRDRYDKFRERFPETLPIWVVENELQSGLTEGSMPAEFEKEYQEDRREKDSFSGLEDLRINEWKKDKRKRPFKINTMNPHELNGQLDLVCDINRNLPFPEVIVVKDRDSRQRQSLVAGQVERIRKKIKEALEKNGVINAEELAQPMIVAVTNDAGKRKNYEDQGADLAVSELDVVGLYNFTQMAASVKNRLAAISPEKMKEEKKRIVEDFIKTLG